MGRTAECQILAAIFGTGLMIFTSLCAHPSHILRKFPLAAYKFNPIFTPLGAIPSDSPGFCLNSERRWSDV